MPGVAVGRDGKYWNKRKKENEKEKEKEKEKAGLERFQWGHGTRSLERVGMDELGAAGGVVLARGASFEIARS